MAEPQAYIYEPYITHMGRFRILVQLFRHPDSGVILHAQLCHENAAGGWSRPYTLETYSHDRNTGI